MIAICSDQDIDSAATYGDYSTNIYDASDIVHILVDQWNGMPLAGAYYLVYGLILEFVGPETDIWSMATDVPALLLFEFGEESMDSEEDYLFI